MRPRGFTLLEVVLVLAVLVAVVSLVGPALVGRIAPATFERSVIQADNALRIAREDARRTGELVFVYAEQDSEGRTTLVSRPSMLDTAASFPGSAGQTGPQAGGVPEGIGGLGAGPIDSSETSQHLLLELPSRISLTGEQPAMIEDLSPLAGIDLGDSPSGSAVPSAESLSPDGFPTGVETGSDEPRLLVVFIPDGTAVFPGSVWLTDDQGRAAELVVHTATGRARFEPTVQNAASRSGGLDDLDGPDRRSDRQPGSRPDRQSDRQPGRQPDRQAPLPTRGGRASSTTQQEPSPTP